MTAIAASNSVNVGSVVPVNFNINNIVSGMSYTMTYTNSSSGVIDYNGTSYTPGEVINLGNNPSSFVATYTGSVAGAHGLAFTVTCDGNVSKSANVNITYNNIDFNSTIHCSK